MEWADIILRPEQSLLLDLATFRRRVVAVGERGQVLVSEDGGYKWVQARIPTRSTLTAIAMVSEQEIWVVGHDAVVLHSSNGGHEWDLQHLRPELGGPLLDVWFENDSHGIAVGAYGLVLETHNGGKHWERRNISHEEPHLYAIAQGRDHALYIAGEFGSLYRSGDRGVSWSALMSPYRGSFFGAVALSDGALLAFGLRGNLYRSEDAGGNWRRLATNTTASLMGGVERRDGTVVIVGLSGTVLVSRDRGRSFVSVNRKNSLVLANITTVASGRLITVGEAGIGDVDAIP